LSEKEKAERLDQYRTRNASFLQTPRTPTTKTQGHKEGLVAWRVGGDSFVFASFS